MSALHQSPHPTKADPVQAEIYLPPLPYRVQINIHTTSIPICHRATDGFKAKVQAQRALRLINRLPSLDKHPVVARAASQLRYTIQKSDLLEILHRSEPRHRRLTTIFFWSRFPVPEVVYQAVLGCQCCSRITSMCALVVPSRIIP